MRLRIVLVGIIGLIGVGLQAADKIELKDQKDKVSYSLGLNLGTSWKQRGIEVDVDLVALGVKDALAGTNTLLAPKEVQEVLMAFQKELMAKQEERFKALGEKNKREGEAFLAENKKKEGVKTLPSGLQYKIITEGSGPIPKATDTVKTQYRGTLIDNTEFDSSYKRGQPATFAVGGVIKGWTEALQLMKVGSKWQLFVPANLAYGERGAGRDIGPNATLIFEIELLAIETPPSS
jgi:FKBP-type peptidyl-prolyl cis-trans isomerase